MALTDAYQAGLKYLTRREHGKVELARKLRAKGFSDAEVEKALETLSAENYLSDDRFSECYIRSRLNSGWGPVMIVQELLAKGVSETLINEKMADFASVWHSQAAKVRQKKFGDAWPSNFQDKAKQMRFLQYRGFSSAEINAVFDMAIDTTGTQ